METGKFMLNEAWVRQRNIAASSVVRVGATFLGIEYSTVPVQATPLPSQSRSAGRWDWAPVRPSWQRGSSDQNIRGLKSE